MAIGGSRETEEEDEPVNGNGMCTVTFSISAGEGRNIVLRNLLGKIAANLALMSSMPQARPPRQPPLATPHHASVPPLARS